MPTAKWYEKLVKEYNFLDHDTIGFDHRIVRGQLGLEFELGRALGNGQHLASQPIGIRIGMERLREPLFGS